MTDSATPDGTGTNAAPAATSGEDVEIPRSAVETIVEFADMELDSMVDFAIALAAVKTFTTPGEIASANGGTVQLPRETVDTFESYLSEFDTDEPDVSLLYDEEFWDQFDEATASARQALTEQ